MKGNGNSFGILFKKLYFRCLPTSGMRSKYIRKHKSEFKKIGKRVFWQPRIYPTDPEYIAIGNNVKIASGVQFVNHDIINSMFCDKDDSCSIPRTYYGCIEIGDNVMIGMNSIILPNVRIGSDVIIAAGAVISKDIPSGEIWGGVPARHIGYTKSIFENRVNMEYPANVEIAWKGFNASRNI